MKIIFSKAEFERLLSLKRTIVELFGEGSQDFSANLTDDYKGVDVTIGADDIRINLNPELFGDYIDTLSRMIATVAPAAIAFHSSIKKAQRMSDLFDMRWSKKGGTKS